MAHKKTTPIFVSDLDKTLVYTGDHSEERVLVEQIEDYAESYMHSEAIAQLKPLCRTGQFVPCTTRTYKQFSRIDLKGVGLDYKFAIVENGATILVNGTNERTR